MAFRIVIPARYASTRLPAKSLADIGGKAMVVRVVEAVKDCGAIETWVATDDARVKAVVEAHGHCAMLTAVDHQSGTDRLAEVATNLGWPDDAIVVNVQGDEPLIEPSLVIAVAQALQDNSTAAIATAAHDLHDAADFFNPNVVKVVSDKNGRAMYFSRAPIPWARDAFANSATNAPQIFPAGFSPKRHIGIYAYCVAFLKQYHALGASPMEQWESLEQLRALWHGFPIQVVICNHAPAAGVDTPEDLARVREIFATR